MAGKHTPGPWHRRIGREGDGSARSQHEQICNAQGVAVTMLEHDGSAEAEANACLIVAAPTLYMAAGFALRALSAAREMLGVFEDNGGHDGLSGKGYRATLDEVDSTAAALRAAMAATQPKEKP